MDTELRRIMGHLTFAAEGSHKGQNGRLLLIGGSALFHAASLWSLTVASRIVDLVHYCSVEENNEIVRRAKAEFRNGIVISRSQIDDYIEEDDCILIGPGMTRDGETKLLTDNLLAKYPRKQWVIDAGALQLMDLRRMPEHAVVTPHHAEFASLGERSAQLGIPLPHDETAASVFAAAYRCIVLLKGATDTVTDGVRTQSVEGGNAGMTKGGTGDVLAGLAAALACKNDPYTAALAASHINKAAGDDLFRIVGPFFNATDLADQIPRTMKRGMP